MTKSVLLATSGHFYTVISPFKTRSAATIENSQLRTTLARSTGLLQRLRGQSLDASGDPDALHAAAAAIRRETLANLPALLTRLEDQVIANRGQVFWAENATAAARYIVTLAKSRPTPTGSHRSARRVLQSRSAIIREIGLDAALTAAGVPVVQTQLGDYVNQLADEAPSHPVYPALHARKETVAALFEDKLDMPQTVDVQAMASMARYKLRREFIQGDMAISGLDFAVAENGVLALFGDSGNVRLTTSLPATLVVIMGIEQLAPSMDDLFILCETYARNALGRPIPGDLNLIRGPAGPDDPDGPRELHLVILDNGRSDLLRLGYGEALACIRCGACMNVCPVYQQIGGQVYASNLPGPLGSVTAPLMPEPPRGNPLGRSKSRPRPVDLSPLLDTPFIDLPQASTLCGACRDVCSVGIDIPRLLLDLRQDLRAAGRSGPARRLGVRLWAWTVARPGRYRAVTRLLAWTGRLFGGKNPRPGRLPPPFYGWTRDRDLPLPARRSFHRRWAERSVEPRKPADHV